MKLPAFSDDGDLHVVIETPRGSLAKLDYDPKLKTFTLSKSLLAGLTYPYDWGFIPATAAEDGDPLDVMVIHEAATFPGLVLTCKIIARDGSPLGELVILRKCWRIGRPRMSRTKAVILILVGIGFGLLALVFAESGSLVYILWAVSICLVLYGIYLYANKSRQNSH